MTNLFVVGAQKDLGELAPALLRARTSAKVRDAALDAIRLANPGLDLDAITPGTVLVVPAVPGVKPQLSAAPVRGPVDDLSARVEEGIALLVAAAESAEKQGVAERSEAEALFADPIVKRLTGQVPELAANIESVTETLDSDAAAAEQAVSQLQESAQLWSADLEALRSVHDV